MTDRNVSLNGPRNSGDPSNASHLNAQPAPISETQQPSASQSPVVAGNLPSANRELAVIEERLGAMIRVVMQVLEPLNSKAVPPELERGSASTSYYHGGKNVIHIRPEDAENLDAYCEEVAHWARKMAVAGLSNTPISLTRAEQHAVDEFFGYLGRFAIPELCRDAGLDLSWGKSAVDQSVDIQSAELYWRKRIDSVRGLSRNHNLQSAWDDYQKLTSYGEVVLGNIQVLDDFYFQLDDTKGPEEVALGAQRALRPFLDCYGAFSKDKAFPQELSANLSSQKKKIEDLCRAWLKQAQRETFDSEEEQRKFLEVFVDQVFDELDQVRSFAHLLATGFHEESFRKWSLGLKFGEIEHSTSSHSAGYLSGTKIVAETPGARRSDLFLKLLPEPNDLIFRDYITYDENGKLRQPGLSSFVSRAVSAVRDFFWRK